MTGGQIPSGNLGRVETSLPHLALMMATDNVFIFQHLVLTAQATGFTASKQQQSVCTEASPADGPRAPEPTEGAGGSRVRRHN